MQLDPIGVAAAHLGDLLAFFDSLVFLDHQGLVVGIGSQKGVVVLEDDQVAVATQPGTGVHHPTVCSCNDGVPGFACNVKALVLGLIKTSHQRALGGPDPGNVIFTGRGCGTGRGRRRRSCRAGGSGTFCTRCCSGRTWRDRPGHHQRVVIAWRRHTQHLADFNGVGGGQVIPANNIAPVLACFQADANHRIARLDGVIAWLAGIFSTGHGGFDVGCNRCRRAGQTGAAVFHRCVGQRAG